MGRKIKTEEIYMKTLLLVALFAVSCSSRHEEPKQEQQQDVQTIEQEERARTGNYSDEMGPGYDYGTTSSQRN